MYKLIVVDDEVNAIEGLKILIDKERNNISEILTSQNAIEALVVIEKERPDIIVSDISMPQMTGLEMIAEIKLMENYNPMIIILSGYSTFTYAQTAMSHGVKAYLLKPVDEDELNDKIDELIGEIETTKQLNFEKNIVLYGIIQKFLNGDKNSKNFEKFKNLIDIEKGNSIILSASNFIYKADQDIDLTDEQIELDYEKIKDITTSHFDDVAIHSFLISSNEILNIFSGKTITETDVKASFANACKDILTKLEIKISTSFSSSLTEIDDVPNGIVDIVNEIENTKPTIMPDEQLSSADFRELNDIFTLLATNFDTMFIEELQEHLNSALNTAITLNVPTTHFTAIFNAFLINITRFVSNAYDDVNSILSHGSEISNKYSNIGDAKDDYINFIVEIFNKMTDYNKKLQNETFYNIITYINTNFTENLTLKSLALKFYVNPIYLGRVFKKKTGTLFNEYLTNLRIDKSKILLKKTTRKVYEIASEIGFNDPNYFIAKFLKSEGITPSQFRKKID